MVWANHAEIIRIRGMTKRDFDHLVSVLDRWWGGPAGQRAAPQYFYEFGQSALVAESKEELVGFLLGFQAPVTPPLNLPLGYVHLVGIHPEHRRKGVGKMLYERFELRCREVGAKRIKAISPVGDEGALRFHVALGFAAEEVVDYAGPGRARMVYLRELSNN